MNTKFWGPSGWEFLHSIVTIYPTNPTLTDKMLMRDFINIICDVLPCKYCRASFTKYSQSLPIMSYLEDSQHLQEWMYRMHNKVNSKLRRQGFCTKENPTLEQVMTLYNKKVLLQIENICSKNTTKDLIEKCMHVIIKLGYTFLGSIIFNYQGYYANCHTSEEKNKIVMNYHKLFNMIPYMICQYVCKIYENMFGKKLEMTEEQMQLYMDMNRYKIRHILSHNEPYSKLKLWYLEDELYSFNIKYTTKVTAFFESQIINNCNIPTADNIKSCRKLSKKKLKLI